MTEKELVERISLARTMANMSARELSLKADVNGAYISRLETANTVQNKIIVFMSKDSYGGISNRFYSS